MICLYVVFYLSVRAKFLSAVDSAGRIFEDVELMPASATIHRYLKIKNEHPGTGKRIAKS